MHATTAAFTRTALGHLPAAPCFPRPNSPTRPGESPGPDLPARDAVRLAGKSILVVEDDGTVRTLVHRILVKAGYNVDTAENGEAGWDKLNQRSYDLLITDHEMPLLTGLDLIERLRRKGFSLPVILMSGAIVTGSLSSKSENRPNVFLSKPFSLPTLVTEVESQLIAA